MTGDEDGGDRVIGGRPVRSALHLFWRFSRGLTLGVRVAILDGEERVFLIRHTYAPGWHLPGGGVEPGETMLDAATREGREEAQIELLSPPALHGIFFNRKVTPRDHILVYVARDFRVIAPKRPDREIAEAGFFPLAKLPEGTTPGTRRRLVEIVEDQAPAQDW